MRLDANILDNLCEPITKRSGNDHFVQSLGVFRLVAKEIRLDVDLDDWEGFVLFIYPKNRNRELSSGDELLSKEGAEFFTNSLACGDQRFSGVDALHPDTCSLAARFDNDRQRELHENRVREASQILVLIGKCSWDGNAYGAKDALARKLVHTQCAHIWPRTGIRDPMLLKNPLNRAVFPVTAMETNKSHIDFIEL